MDITGKIIEHGRNRPTHRGNITDGRWKSFVPATAIAPTVSETSSIPSMRCSIIPNTASAMPNLKRELPRIPFVGVNGIVLGNNASPAEAKQGLAQGGGPGKKNEMNSSTSLPKAVAGERSSEATNQTQSANAGEGARATNFMNDLDVFRAFVKAGERLL